MWFRSDLLSQCFQSVSQAKNYTFTKAHSRTLGRTLCPSSFLCLVLASSGSLYTLPVSGLGLSSPVPGLASSSLTLSHSRSTLCNTSAQHTLATLPHHPIFFRLRLAAVYTAPSLVTLSSPIPHLERLAALGARLHALDAQALPHRWTLRAPIVDPAVAG